jgi:hypothetical protein
MGSMPVADRWRGGWQSRQTWTFLRRRPGVPATVDFYGGPMTPRLIKFLSAGAIVAASIGVTAYGQIASGAPLAESASSSSSPGSTPGTGSVATPAPAFAPATPIVAAVPGAPTQASFVAGSAATMIVDSAGGTLRIVAFAPHPGWSLVRLEQRSLTELEAWLESTAGQVHFAAQLANGVVTPQLEISAVPGNSVVPNTAPGGTAPSNSAPDNSTPGNTTPDDGGDDNGGRGRGGDDGPGDDNSGRGGGDD